MSEKLKPCNIAKEIFTIPYAHLVKYSPERPVLKLFFRILSLKPQFVFRAFLLVLSFFGTKVGSKLECHLRSFYSCFEFEIISLNL